MMEDWTFGELMAMLAFTIMVLGLLALVRV